MVDINMFLLQRPTAMQMSSVMSWRCEAYNDVASSLDRTPKFMSRVDLSGELM